ncbi:bacterioferritin-associated ferredoxin [Roseateles sp. BYS180W]|uniref:Bacterioferritin-associated ferredoxin n=1 Tax=Roseateles rivi TaxID=3299028 RepID=A0ABW7FRT5_9BURK
MIVCLCHRVSDRDIHRYVQQGGASFEDLQEETRLASSCGACGDCAQEVFAQTLSACQGGSVGFAQSWLGATGAAPRPSGAWPVVAIHPAV